MNEWIYLFTTPRVSPFGFLSIRLFVEVLWLLVFCFWVLNTIWNRLKTDLGGTNLFCHCPGSTQSFDSPSENYRSAILQEKEWMRNKPLTRWWPLFLSGYGSTVGTAGNKQRISVNPTQMDCPRARSPTDVMQGVLALMRWNSASFHKLWVPLVLKWTNAWRSAGYLNDKFLLVWLVFTYPVSFLIKISLQCLICLHSHSILSRIKLGAGIDGVRSTFQAGLNFKWHVCFPGVFLSYSQLRDARFEKMASNNLHLLILFSSTTFQIPSMGGPFLQPTTNTDAIAKFRRFLNEQVDKLFLLLHRQRSFPEPSRFP